jgi:hypothetical protein
MKDLNRKDILEQAIRLTTNDRNLQHGEPYINHDNIARIWSVILGRKVEPFQVALCMAGLKLARLACNPDNMDSYIDGAAYLAIAGELVNFDKL